jgi:hypothetical protein
MPRRTAQGISWGASERCQLSIPGLRTDSASRRKAGVDQFPFFGCMPSTPLSQCLSALMVRHVALASKVTLDTGYVVEFFCAIAVILSAGYMAVRTIVLFIHGLPDLLLKWVEIAEHGKRLLFFRGAPSGVSTMSTPLTPVTAPVTGPVTIVTEKSVSCGQRVGRRVGKGVGELVGNPPTLR